MAGSKISTAHSHKTLATSHKSKVLGSIYGGFLVGINCCFFEPAREFAISRAATVANSLAGYKNIYIVYTLNI